jgi:hypothetical protein
MASNLETPLHQNPYAIWTMEAAVIASDIANYCDHSEHVEETNPLLVAHRAADLRDMAFEIADHERVDILQLYAARLGSIARQNAVYVPKHSFKSERRVREVETLHDLQVAQAKHNRTYHPDVAGLSRADQLRHFSLHVSKLVGALSEQAVGIRDRNDFIRRRLPDMLVFGVLVATAVNDRLPDAPLFPTFL